MENKSKQYPKIRIGAFIFNNKEEVLMMRSQMWDKKYIIPGGEIMNGEKMEDALKRLVNEDTGIKIKDLIFLSIHEALLTENKSSHEGHYIFINYKAKEEGSSKIKLNKDAISYKWRSVEEWLEEKDLSENIKNILINVIINETQSEFYHKYKRALADYHNLQKQTAVERQDFIKYANEQLLYKLIPVYDNLKMSVNQDNNDKKDAWFEGVKYVVKQFKDILDEIGVVEIETLGKEFDHNTMEAVEGQGDIVVKELKPGYKLNGKVIIHAKVIVGEKDN